MKVIIILLLAALMATGFIVYKPKERKASQYNGSLTKTEILPNTRIQKRLDRLQAVYVRKGAIYGVEERSVYVSDDEGSNFREIGYLPRSKTNDSIHFTWLKDTIAKNDLVRRYRRTIGAASLVVLESGTIIVISDQIYRMAEEDKNFKVIPTSLNLLPPFQSGRSIAVGPDDYIYYGEYTTNKKTESIRVIRGLNDGKDWSIAYTFPQNKVFHVHSICWDKYRARYWVTTGDSDDESHILFTSDGFKSIESLGGGSQDWRAMALIIEKNRLLWASDDGRKPSSIFSWEFGSNLLVKMQTIGNPSSYLASLADGTKLVSTTYVPQTEYGHSAHATKEAALWASKDGQNWKKVLNLAESTDRLDFERPQIRLPGGDDSMNFAFVTPLYTYQHNFELLKIQFDWE